MDEWEVYLKDRNRNKEAKKKNCDYEVLTTLDILTWEMTRFQQCTPNISLKPVHLAGLWGFFEVFDF